MATLSYVGFIKKTHGFKGAVKIHSDNSSITLKEKEPLMLEINKKVVPFFMSQISKSGSEYQVLFEDIASLEEAEEIVGLSVYIESDQSTEPEAWISDTLGYKIMDQNMGPIGVVIEHIHKPGQDLLEIEFKSKTYFIPFVEELILNFDNKLGIIYTNLPDGLLTINE